jgi:hypothetical protein
MLTYGFSCLSFSCSDVQGVQGVKQVPGGNKNEKIGMGVFSDLFGEVINNRKHPMNALNI